MKAHTIRICGKEWTIRYKKEITGRGQFNFQKFLIEIDSTEDAQIQREAILHEVLEVILVSNDLRFESRYGSHLFSFYHSEFMRVVEEFSVVLKQLTKLRLL